MNRDLDRVFAEMRTSLPKDARSRIVFSGSSFPSCPERIETNRLVLTKSIHGCGSGYRTDVIKFHANRETFQKLGLLILAVVFRPGGHRTHIILNLHALHSMKAADVESLEVNGTAISGLGALANALSKANVTIGGRRLTRCPFGSRFPSGQRI